MNGNSGAERAPPIHVVSSIAELHARAAQAQPGECVYYDECFYLCLEHQKLKGPYGRLDLRDSGSSDSDALAYYAPWLADRRCTSEINVQVSGESRTVRQFIGPRNTNAEQLQLHSLLRLVTRMQFRYRGGSLFSVWAWIRHLSPEPPLGLQRTITNPEGNDLLMSVWPHNYAPSEHGDLLWRQLCQSYHEITTPLASLVLRVRWRAEPEALWLLRQRGVPLCLDICETGLCPLAGHWWESDASVGALLRRPTLCATLYVLTGPWRELAAVLAHVRQRSRYRPLVRRVEVLRQSSEPDELFALPREGHFRRELVRKWPRLDFSASACYLQYRWYRRHWAFCERALALLPLGLAHFLLCDIMRLADSALDFFSSLAQLRLLEQLQRSVARVRAQRGERRLRPRRAQ